MQQDAVIESRGSHFHEQRGQLSGCLTVSAMEGRLEVRTIPLGSAAAPHSILARAPRGLHQKKSKFGGGSDSGFPPLMSSPTRKRVSEKRKIRSLDLMQLRVGCLA
jgi:hypothetical protein